MLSLGTKKQNAHRSLAIVASICAKDSSMGSDRKHHVISFASRLPEGQPGNLEVSS